MKKYFPVILFLATITLSACGSPKIESEKVESQKVESENIETKKSLKELLGLGTSQKCSYEIKTEDQNMKGEVLETIKQYFEARYQNFVGLKASMNFLRLERGSAV